MTTTDRPRDRLANAAFQLFAERGYEGTTVEDVAERAGLGRATFFRHYRGKDDVIFPDHDRLLEQVRARLASSNQATALAAVSDAVRLVLMHYVAEGEKAKTRYVLTSSVPALRNREIATVARYQRLFREFIGVWMGDSQDAALRAELMSAAVVSAHNHVLRRWLRGACTEPEKEVDAALRHVMDLFPAAGRDADGATGTMVVAFRADRDLDQILPALRSLLGEQQTPT
jgi:AcrR family transcriptional regulator